MPPQQGEKLPAPELNSHSPRDAPQGQVLPCQPTRPFPTCVVPRARHVPGDTSVLLQCDHRSFASQIQGGPTRAVLYHPEGASRGSRPPGSWREDPVRAPHLPPAFRGPGLYRDGPVPPPRQLVLALATGCSSECYLLLSQATRGPGGAARCLLLFTVVWGVFTVSCSRPFAGTSQLGATSRNKGS